MRRLPQEQLVAIVDDNGKHQGHFNGIGAEHDAQAHIRACAKAPIPKRGTKKGTGLEYMKHCTIVRGEDARKAIENGRI